MRTLKEANAKAVENLIKEIERAEEGLKKSRQALSEIDVSGTGAEVRIVEEKAHTILRVLSCFALNGDTCPYCLYYATGCDVCEWGKRNGICGDFNDSRWREVIKARDGFKGLLTQYGKRGVPVEEKNKVYL